MKSVIDRRYPLEQISEVAMLKKGKKGKCIYHSSAESAVHGTF